MNLLNTYTYKGLTLDKQDSFLKVTPSNKVDHCLRNSLLAEKHTLLSLIEERESLLACQGVGTQLSSLLPGKLFASPSCNCKDTARRYDELGPLWCRENKEAIIKALEKEAAKVHLSLLKWGIPLLVEKAISKAEKISQERLSSYSSSLFVGVTTAPRTPSTLLPCLYSLQCAGFSPIVFAEPGSQTTKLPTVHNTEKLGIWRNWVSMVKYALSTSASSFLFVQDDIVFHEDTKEFLEGIEVEGFLSLYTSRKYGYRKEPGIHRVYTKSLWGACALYFPRRVLEQVYSHSIISSWKGAASRGGRKKRLSVYKKREEDPTLIGNSDTAIGKIMNSLDLPMLFISPSPGTHIASTSTVKHGGNGGNRNCYPCASPTLPLAEQVYEKL